MTKEKHPRWQGGPPDYMWWLVTIVQLLSIVLHFILSLRQLQ